jgi:hypothetical protein
MAAYLIVNTATLNGEELHHSRGRHLPLWPVLAEAGEPPVRDGGA